MELTDYSDSSTPTFSDQAVPNNICTCSAAPYPHPIHYSRRRNYPSPPARLDLSRGFNTRDIVEPTGDSHELSSPDNTIWPQLNGTEIQTVAALVQLAEVQSENFSQINPNLASDARWTEKIARLPLELGHGYLPEEEPVQIPTRSDILEPGNAPLLVNDDLGPPSCTKFYSTWQSEDRVTSLIRQNSLLSDKDYQKIRNALKSNIDRTCGYKTNTRFVLPLEWRESLYRTLFHPIKFTVCGYDIKDPLIESIVESKIMTIHFIESFLLRVLAELEAAPFPGLKCFLDDFAHFSKILQRPVKLNKVVHEMRYDQVTLWSEDKDFVKLWSRRWLDCPGEQQKKIANSETVRRNYVCALIDVMFGIWIAPGKCLFHDGWLPSRLGTVAIPSDTDDTWRESHWASTEQAVPRCIHNELFFWEHPPPQTPTMNRNVKDVADEASTSLSYLDASFIEFGGPFKFQETKRLNEHLVIDEDENILIYTDWKHLLMLRHLNILIAETRYDVDEISQFQLLSRSIRTPHDRHYGLDGDIRYIAYELLQTYVLFFYSGRADKTDGKMGPLFSHVHRSSLFDSTTSDKIAERLGIDLGDHRYQKLLEEVRGMFSKPFPRQTESSDFYIFRRRLENINDTIMEWRPRSFVHAMYYGGYSQDSGAYLQSALRWIIVPFGIVVSICSIMSAIASVIQVTQK